jgi:hypothetical protein
MPARQREHVAGRVPLRQHGQRLLSQHAHAVGPACSPRLDPGLPGAGTGQHQHRSRHGLHDAVPRAHQLPDSLLRLVTPHEQRHPPVRLDTEALPGGGSAPLAEHGGVDAIGNLVDTRGRDAQFL